MSPQLHILGDHSSVPPGIDASGRSGRMRWMDRTVTA